MSAPRYICIHGHFYQPPRENPWLEAVEVQDSAKPDHDWNERITRECYGPNTRSRLVDGQGKITNLLNNYGWMSFNVGPTLLSWMAEAAPRVLDGIVEGDRASRERHRGHGNALAQAYNHMIMPLAQDRDKKTQVLWGIADFRRRFGREPEGMWLPETAANVATLEALAAAGIRFTVLAPRQARRWRRLGDRHWFSQQGAIDPSRAYLCRLPSGKSIALFFYDGIISQQVAFERLLESGEKFRGRLMQGFDDRRAHPQLVHIATDGESYGHHHAFGDMALAYVLDRLRQDPNIRLINYGEYLELHPPEWEAQIHDNSSWSCVHGVERWRANCGCRTRGDWQQEWRGPLRHALDQLRARLDSLFEERGRELFRDLWAARDAYVEVMLDRRPQNVLRFFREQEPGVRNEESGHGSQHSALSTQPSGNGTGHLTADSSPLTPEAETRIRQGLWLLEMQRHGMLMYTSCGWFFDELSGLETTQCLRYAARAIQLARHFDQDLEKEFVEGLEKAPSNLPEFGNGRGVWEQLVRPARIELDRVLAHHAMSLLHQPRPDKARVYCYDLETLDQEVRGNGLHRTAIGRMRVFSELTWNRAEASFVVLHYGGLDFHTVLRKERSAEEYEAIKQRLLETCQSGSLADVTTLVAQEFQGEVYRLDDLFTDEQRRIIAIVLTERFADYQHAFERLAQQDAELVQRLGKLRYPIPQPMRATATAYLDWLLREQIANPATNGEAGRIRALVASGQTWGHEPDRQALRKALAQAMRDLLRSMQPQADLAALIAKASRLLDVAALLRLSPDLWDTQNDLLDVHAQLNVSGVMPPELHEGFVQLASKLNLKPELMGWKP